MPVPHILEQVLHGPHCNQTVGGEIVKTGSSVVVLPGSAVAADVGLGGGLCRVIALLDSVKGNMGTLG